MNINVRNPIVFFVIAVTMCLKFKIQIMAMKLQYIPENGIISIGMFPFLTLFVCKTIFRGLINLTVSYFSISS